MPLQQQKMKQCFTCKETKDDSEFCKNKANTDGLNSYCKPCHKKRNHESTLRRQFGTTPEAYYTKLERQDGVCAICGKTDLRGWRLTQDHNHKTGKARGLLCMLCNTALGSFGDDITNLEKAIQYLQMWMD